MQISVVEQTVKSFESLDFKNMLGEDDVNAANEEHLLSR